MEALRLQQPAGSNLVVQAASTCGLRGDILHDAPRLCKISFAELMKILPAGLDAQIARTRIDDAIKETDRLLSANINQKHKKKVQDIPPHCHNPRSEYVSESRMPCSTRSISTSSPTTQKTAR